MHAEKASQYTWKNLHEILGVPLGASVEHIKRAYRLLSKKNSVTDAAYQTLIDSKERRKYDALLRQRHPSGAEDGQDWGKRGRERCSCGRFLEEDDDWYCSNCLDGLAYIVAFDMSGARIVHQDEFQWPAAGSKKKASDPVAFGPFTKEEAEEFVAEKTKQRDRGKV